MASGRLRGRPAARAIFNRNLIARLHLPSWRNVPSDDYTSVTNTFWRWRPKSKAGGASLSSRTRRINTPWRDWRSIYVFAVRPRRARVANLSDAYK